MYKPFDPGQPFANAAEIRAALIDSLDIQDDLQKVISLDITEVQKFWSDESNEIPPVVTPPWKVSLLRRDLMVDGTLDTQLTAAIRLNREEAFDWLAMQSLLHDTPHNLKMHGNTRWLVGLFFFYSPSGKTSFGFESSAVIQIDKDGIALPLTYNEPILLNKRGGDLVTGDKAMQEAMLNNRAIRRDVVQMAFGLANCKNVSIGRMSSKIREGKYQKREGVTYKELLITPRNAQNGEKSGRAMAFTAKRAHLSRGHFKDYREKGLFGQHKGIYWWESQVRGKGPGKVLKSYAV